jgi:hypothetical protein
MRGATFYRVPVDQLVPRSMRREEARDVRRVWWNQARLGYRLPAEPGMILIEGGRR